MNRRIFRTVLGIVALAALLGVPNTAASDGLPLPSSITPTNGVQGADGTRYITRPSDGTTVVRQLGSSGSVQAATVNGQWWIPAVTANGAPGGLSADGSTLVLVKSGSRVRTRQRDCWSWTRATWWSRSDSRFRERSASTPSPPTGRSSTSSSTSSAHDRTRYAVRAYDRRAGQMLRDPIVDPNEHAGEMRGYPIIRRTSPDGRWDYTFYGVGDKPFVHALDTGKGRAVCIDLDGLVKPANVDITRMAMSSDGQRADALDQRQARRGHRHRHAQGARSVGPGASERRWRRRFSVDARGGGRGCLDRRQRDHGHAPAARLRRGGTRGLRVGLRTLITGLLAAGALVAPAASVSYRIAARCALARGRACARVDRRSSSQEARPSSTPRQLMGAWLGDDWTLAAGAANTPTRVGCQPRRSTDPRLRLHPWHRVRRVRHPDVSVQLPHAGSGVLCTEPESRRPRPGDSLERARRRPQPQLPRELGADRSTVGFAVFGAASLLRAGDAARRQADPGHSSRCARSGFTRRLSRWFERLGRAFRRHGGSHDISGSSATRTCRFDACPGSPAPPRTGRTTRFAGPRRSWSSCLRDHFPNRPPRPSALQSRDCVSAAEGPLRTRSPYCTMSRSAAFEGR